MTRSKRNGAPSDWLILGVDSGGTKSEVVLADGDGIVLGRGVCAYDDPASGRGPGGSGRTDASVRAAIGRCRSEAGASALAGRNGLGERTLCVVGRGRLPDGSIPSGSFRDIVYRPVREQDGPLALAGAQAGIVVLAGTGAFVYGRTPDGAELHLDSLGPLLGDAGSAFEIGLRAMRAF
ncbi:MAG: hypothetical protein FJX72_19970, partial [Armatimonadetes bacterium]|nr:hypothetical protein [Armatimonadota bacterium]